MSRDKHIEEMAKATTKHCKIDNQCGSCHWSTCNECLAELLYNAGYRKQEWISVDERFPKHEEQCLIFTKIHFIPDHIDECDYYEGIEISTFYQDRFLSNNGMYATHWMPLPEAPKMKGGAE